MIPCEIERDAQDRDGPYDFRLMRALLLVCLAFWAGILYLVWSLT